MYLAALLVYLLLPGKLRRSKGVVRFKENEPENI